MVFSFNTANMLATQVLVGFQAVQASFLQALEQIPDKENSPSKPVANSTTADITQLNILKLLQSMHAEIKELKEKTITFE